MQCKSECMCVCVCVYRGSVVNKGYKQCLNDRGMCSGEGGDISRCDGKSGGGMLTCGALLDSPG